MKENSQKLESFKVVLQARSLTRQHKKQKERKKRKRKETKKVKRKEIYIYIYISSQKCICETKETCWVGFMYKVDVCGKCRAIEKLLTSASHHGLVPIVEISKLDFGVSAVGCVRLDAWVLLDAGLVAICEAVSRVENIKNKNSDSNHSVCRMLAEDLVVLELIYRK